MRWVPQEGTVRSDHCRNVSSVMESRGVQYSAEAAGTEGSVRCHVRGREIEHDHAQFTIVVCNDSDVDVQAFAFVPAPSDGRHRTIVQTIVGAGSNFSTSVTLGLTPARATPELRVAVTTGATQFTLVVPGRQTEAAAELPSTVSALALPAPLGTSLLGAAPLARNSYTPRFGANVLQAETTTRSIVLPPARSRASPPIVPVGLFFVALLTLVALFFLRPQISGLTVPQNAAGGTTVRVFYAVTGWGTAGYAMLGPDGRTVVTGPLALGQGNFALSLPRAPAAQAYLIRLRMSNPLGAATAEDYVRVAGPPAPAPSAAARPHRAPAAIAPPQIRSLALDRASLASGDTLNVYYDVLATSGSVTFFDPASQITYGRADVTSSGRATFAAPHVDTTRSLTVLVTAQRGNATTQSRIGVTVVPEGVAAGSPDPGVGAAGGDGFDTALSAPASVRSSQPIHVEIRGGAAGLQVFLLDGNGNEVARRDVAAGQGSIDFTAPAVRLPNRFVIEGTYPSGAGTQTIVRPITVTP